MSSEDGNKSFLNVGIPSAGIWGPMGEGRVGYYALRTIDNDYRIGMLASRLGTEKLLAKTLLSQVEMGNVQLQYLDRQAKEQGIMNVELRALRGASTATHEALSDFARRYEVRADAYVEETVGAIREGADLISSAIEDGFDRTIDAIYENGRMVADAIGASTEVLKSALDDIGEQLRSSNDTLKQIAKYLETPGDTRVKELLARSTQLVDEGMKTHGRWRYDNWRDALVVLREAASCAIGSTNPMVWLQIGFLTWKCNERSKMEEQRRMKLSEAKDAFGAAARLFTERQASNFTRSIRHKAHMHYLLGDHRGALATVSTLLKRNASSEVMIEAARYNELVGNRQEALSLIERCIVSQPSYAISIFGEPDFGDMTGELIVLIAGVRERIKSSLSQKISAIAERSLAFDPLVSVDRGKKSGTFALHLRLKEVATPFLQSKNYIHTHRLSAELDSILAQMETSDPSPLDHARILVLYGANGKAVELLQKLVETDRDIVNTIASDGAFASIIDAITPCIHRSTIDAKAEAVREWKRMELIVDIIRGRRAHAQIKSSLSPEFIALFQEGEKIDKMGYAQAVDFMRRARQMRFDAFRELPCRNPSYTANRFSLKFPFVALHEFGTGPLSRSLAQYYFDCLMTMVEEFPGSVVEDVAQAKALLDALERYNQDRVLGRNKLEKNDRNGLGSNWIFHVAIKDQKGRFVNYPFFVPHGKPKHFFGRKIEFKVGDRIELEALLVQWVEKVRDPAFARILRGMIS